LEQNLRTEYTKNKNNNTQVTDELSSLGNELNTGEDELNPNMDNSLDKLENPNENTAPKADVANISKPNNKDNHKPNLSEKHILNHKLGDIAEPTVDNKANNVKPINKTPPVSLDVNAPNVYKHDDVQVKNGEVHIDSTLIIGKRDDLNLKHSKMRNK
jgi:hypothetical protein